jgi:hypothetical protein
MFLLKYAAILALLFTTQVQAQVSREAAEKAILEVTGTSDLYVSKLNRQGRVSCSAEVEVDIKVFRFDVNGGREDLSASLQFDKVTGVLGQDLVTFTKIQKSRNRLKLDFVIQSPDFFRRLNGSLDVKVRRKDGDVTGASVTLDLGGRKLSCDGSAS